MSIRLQHYLATLLFVSATPHAFASAAHVYIASAPAGAADGSSCANPRSVPFFNAYTNWGLGSTQIGPGTTVHLCGVFNAPAGSSGYLAFQGGGLPGSPITLVAEPGAILQAPYWGEDGAITVNQLSYVVLDGRGAGKIRATANGTQLANQGGVCGGNFCSLGIFLLGCNNCAVKNWTIENLYVNVPPNDESLAGQASGGILFNGGDNAVISGNTVHDAKWCITYGFFPDRRTSNVEISGNNSYHCDHGIFVSSDNSGAVLNNLYVHDNLVHDGANWDDNANENHHDGIHISTSQVNTTIDTFQVYNNHIYGDWGANCNAFIYLSAGTDQGFEIRNAKVFNNLLVNNSTVNFCGNGMIQDYGTENALIANNTMIGSSPSAGQALILEEDAGFHTVVRNNIMMNFRSGIYVAQGYNFPISDYNVFSNVTDVAFVWGTACCTFLTEWQGQTGSPDTHSGMGNPNLSATYIPQAGGSAVARGTNLSSLGIGSLNADKLGASRPAGAAWDIGAFASGSAPPAVTISVSPSTVTLGPSGQQQLTALVAGSAAGVTWSMNPHVGTLSPAGFYTAPATFSVRQTVQISASLAGVSSSATLTLVPSPVTVTLAPLAKSLGPSQQQQFSATVGNSIAAVAWSLNPALGTVSPSGMYTAPSAIAARQDVQVIAAAGGVSSRATVTLAPAATGLKVSPSGALLGASQQQQFTAPSGSGTVRWTIYPAIGTMSSTGLYRAPQQVGQPQEVFIRATWPTGWSTALVLLTPAPPPVPTVSPLAKILQAGAQQQFTTTSSEVRWSLSPAVGTVSPSGLYSAPATIASPVIVRVIAESKSNTTVVKATVVLVPRN
jgi:hypothetical protein